MHSISKLLNLASGRLALTFIILSSIASACLGASLPAGTVRLIELKKESGVVYVLQIVGAIAAPLATEIHDLSEQMVQSKRPVLLDLDSGGGSFTEGMKIISWIREQKRMGREIYTTVENGKKCGSMCVPIYAQGQTRYAGEVSAFMFHGAVPNLYTNIPEKRKTEEFLNVLLDAGISSEWIQLMRSREVFNQPGEYWLSGLELTNEKSSIVTKLIPRHVKFEPQEAPFDPQIRSR